MTVYDPQLAAVLAVDSAGKERVREDIETIVALAKKARREGLLALEDDVEALSPALLKLGLRMVLDGTDPETVRRTCSIALHAGDFSGVELMQRLVSLDGAIGIQAGENPQQLKASLAAYLGEDEALSMMDSRWDDDE